MTAAHPLVPKMLSEQRVAAELRTADDKLMTAQIVAGNGSISYECRYSSHYPPGLLRDR